MATELIEKVEKKTYKLTPKQRTEIMVKLAAGARAADLAREYGIDRSNITHLQRRRKHTLKTVERNLLQIEENIQARLLAKTYSVLEKKLDTLKDKTELKKARLDHISSVAQDLWKQTQVEAGKPTDITSSKDTQELTLFLTNNIQHLTNLKPIEALSEGYTG